MSSRGAGTAQPPVEVQIPVEVHLPVEVWQRVAQHMSSRCWAQVSRTCKAMHSVLPKEIDIAIGSASALTWMQFHWGQASKLKLRWTKKEIPWVTAYTAASVTSLKHVELRLLPEMCPNTAMLLMWLLAQAPQLELLYLKCPRALKVPPICSLRHLILDDSTEFTTAVAASIGQLRNLQTLGLHMARCDLGNACAELDLASLPELSNVHIVDVPLPRITLPRHCRLHLSKNDNMMELDTWCDIARHGQLHSINRRSRGKVFVDNMPPSMLELDCSILAWWDIMELGQYLSPAVFLTPIFCSLTHLRLGGKEIHIMLPQELPLQLLHVHAKSLSIVFVNPQEQAKRLQQLQATYCTLRGADIIVVVSLMCGMGAVVRKLIVEGPADEPESYHGLLVSSERVSGDWECPCGSCLRCLYLVHYNRHVQRT